MRLSKKSALLLALAFCFAQVALVGFGTNVSACNGSGWSKTVDNTCDFSGCHHMRRFDHHGWFDHHNNEATPSEQSTTTTTTTTTTPTTTTPSEQSTTTVEEDSGYSVVVGDSPSQTYTGAVGANVVLIAISIAIVGCVAGGLIVFIKKRP